MFDIPVSTGRNGTLHDQVFKDLIGGFLPDFLTLVAPESAGLLDLSHWKLVNKEIFTDWPKGRRRELDLLAEVRFAGRDGPPAFVHVEIEARTRPEMGPRFEMACLRRINAAPLVELSRLLLANCVETYLQLTGRDAEEFEALQAKGGTEEVRVMRRRLTWAEQLVEEGVRKTLLRQLGLRFGPLSDDVKRRVEEIHSVDRLNQITDQILVAHSLEEIGLR